MKLCANILHRTDIPSNIHKIIQCDNLLAAVNDNPLSTFKTDTIL